MSALPVMRMSPGLMVGPSLVSSSPSPSSDTSNSQARAVLSKDEENMKSPVNKI